MGRYNEDFFNKLSEATENASLASMKLFIDKYSDNISKHDTGTCNMDHPIIMLPGLRADVAAKHGLYKESKGCFALPCTLYGQGNVRTHMADEYVLSMRRDGYSEVYVMYVTD